MIYRKLSLAWLKVFCLSLLTTALSGVTSLVLYKTLGVPNSTVSMTGEYPIDKKDLDTNLKNSSWCYKIPGDNGPVLFECGFKKDGRELFYAKDTNNNFYSTQTIKGYFSSMGAEEPDSALSLYWKGKYLYYGYYPGVSIIREGIALLIDMTLYAGLATILLLCIYPILIFAALTINACLSLLNRQRRL